MSHDKTVPAVTGSVELSGKDVNYYLVHVANPKRVDPYWAECEDIIEALGMTFAEGCAFKAIWRSCAARTLGKKKAGQDDKGLYDAHKVEYYAKRMIAARTPKELQDPLNLSEPTCQLSFGSWSCTYKVAGLPNPECPKTLDFCKSIGNEKNFVGELPKPVKF